MPAPAAICQGVKQIIERVVHVGITFGVGSLNPRNFITLIRDSIGNVVKCIVGSERPRAEISPVGLAVGLRVIEIASVGIRLKILRSVRSVPAMIRADNVRRRVEVNVIVVRHVIHDTFAVVPRHVDEITFIAESNRVPRVPLVVAVAADFIRAYAAHCGEHVKRVGIALTIRLAVNQRAQGRLKTRKFRLRIFGVIFRPVRNSVVKIKFLIEQVGRKTFRVVDELNCHVVKIFFLVAQKGRVVMSVRPRNAFAGIIRYLVKNFPVAVIRPTEPLNCAGVWN